MKGGTANMCKLFIAAGPMRRETVLRFIQRAASTFAKSQRDGFGFVAYGPEGVATGRYLEPSNYPGFRANLPAWIDAPLKESGEIPALTTALVCHGRTATSRVTLDNVHPFQRGSTFLCHNGILRFVGDGPEPAARHGCDSDSFLTWLWSRRSSAAAWDATAAAWTGYGVFGIIDSKRGRLTVAKCGDGRLSYAAGERLHLWSTDAADLQSIAGKGTKADPTLGKPFSMRARTRCVFDVSRRAVRLLEIKDWQGFGERVRDTDWFRSMGQPSPSAAAPLARTPRRWEALAREDSFPDWDPTPTPTPTPSVPEVLP